MNITSTNFQTQQALRPSVVKSTQNKTADGLPTDSFTFSGGTITTKEKFQIGTVAAAAGIIGAIPGVGAASALGSAAANEGEDTLGTMIGVAGIVTNLAASLAVFKGNFGVWPMAVPAVLGAISWGGYAANRAGR